MFDQSFLHDWHNQTTLHPLGLVAVIICGAIMLLVPRRWALVPMLVIACFIAPAQRIVILTLDFNLLRVMVLCGWLRLILHHEGKGFRWNVLDTMICIWVVANFTAFSLLHNSMDAVINRLGFGFDAIGTYFLCRFLIRSWGDVEVLIKSAALISIPVASAFLFEKYTGRNIFAVFGGVPTQTLVRGEVLRSQGAFSHPILAGSFWAALIPLIIVMWRCGRSGRILAPVGFIGAVVIIITCASSTPLITLFLGVGTLLLFPLRKHLRWIRLAAVLALVAAHLAMLQPVWHLLARIHLVPGSTGWYRFRLIDDFITHFDEWWLAGTTSIAQWWEWGTNDVTSQYVWEGVNGGLFALILFLTILWLAFRGVGGMIRQSEPRGPASNHAWLAWALGASLFVHVITFISVAYFGQITMLWFLTLAMVGSLKPPPLTLRIARKTEIKPEADRPDPDPHLPRLVPSG